MFELGRVAHTRAHLLADSIETAIAFGDYDAISDTDIHSIMTNAPRVPEELMNPGDSDLDDNDYPDNLDSVEISEKQQQYISDCLQQIEFRIEQFGEFYPFRLKSGVIEMKDLTEKHYIYLLLLSCARIRSFKEIKNIKQKLADHFEVVCLHALRRLVPEDSDVFMFGPKSEDRKKRFSTDLRLALPKLAEALRMQLAPKWEKELSAQGDGKIDLVAIVGPDDPAEGTFAIIAQCASMESENDWQKKRQEADFAYHTGSFHYLAKPQGILFVPVCYRDSSGAWRSDRDVAAVLTLDRLRIVRLIEKYENLPINAQDLLQDAKVLAAA